MADFTIGDVCKVIVVGIKNYGIFVNSIEDDEYSGLIHISEISADFVKNIFDVANVNDILYAKILDVDNDKKQLKLSIKALASRSRYRNSLYNGAESDSKSDFTPLKDNLDNWIKEQLKEKNNG